MFNDEWSARLRERFGEDRVTHDARVDEVTLASTAATLIEDCMALRDDFHFENLIDVCGVDYAAYGNAEWDVEDVTGCGFNRGREDIRTASPEDESQGSGRFVSVYHLLSIAHNARLRVKVPCENDGFPVVPSVVDIWSAANWFEREAFDLYGIVYSGHPDLRRLLTDYGFVGHPFRKDFPLSGHVEMRYDPEKGRVIYQPVSIEPRVLVPRVIRHDSRYEDGAGTQESAHA